MNRLVYHLILTLILPLVVEGADVYVDHVNGKDQNSGTSVSPLKSINTAIARAEPGDTVYILPSATPIRGNIVIRNKKGESEKPIVIDAMFNTFVGTRPIRTENWQLIDSNKGIYCSKEIKFDPGMSSRFFMVLNGKMNRMGRHTKWKGNELKSPQDLNDYEWTIVQNKKVYLKLPVGKTLEQENIEEPNAMATSGVKINGECAFISIRNVITWRFWNDGFNIHNNCRNILIDTVAALENCDDGISAHETSQLKVNDMLSLHNGTGFCHIEQAEVEHDNIYIEGSDSRDIYLLNKTNILKNVVVVGNSPGGIQVKEGNVSIFDCLFLNYHKNATLVLPSELVKSKDLVIDGYSANSDMLNNANKGSKLQPANIKRQLLSKFPKSSPAIAAISTYD